MDGNANPGFAAWAVGRKTVLEGRSHRARLVDRGALDRDKVPSRIVLIGSDNRHLKSVAGGYCPPLILSRAMQTTFELLAEQKTQRLWTGRCNGIADETVQHWLSGAILKHHTTRGVINHPTFTTPAKSSPRMVKRISVFNRGCEPAGVRGGGSASQRDATGLRARVLFRTSGGRLLEEQVVRERDAVGARSSIWSTGLRHEVRRRKESVEFCGCAHERQTLALWKQRAIVLRSIAAGRSSGPLILCDPDGVHLKKLFRNTGEVREIASDLLFSSKHPGVISLVVDSLAHNYPLPKAISAFERRTDPEFIGHLLKNWPRELTEFQQNNLEKLDKVAWLDPDGVHLDLLPAELHRAAIAFLMATGLSETQKMDVLEWMVKFGSPEGRLAATEVLKELDDANVQEVVRDGLESKEPEVQAWATSQLRAWSIPNAMELLVERIDSPSKSASGTW